MARNLNKSSVPSTATSASFSQLEDCMRQVRWLLILTVAIVAVLPTMASFFLDIRRDQMRAQVDAREVVFIVDLHFEKQGSSLTNLSPKLLAMMKNDQIAFLQLLGAKEDEVLRLGEPSRYKFAFTARASFSPPVHQIRSVVIQRDVRPLFSKSFRVVGIHIFVAVTLSLLIYVIPMRALRQAINDVQSAHAQIIHSEKLSAIGEVYASLTHEINNPLSILLTRVKLLIRSAQTQQFPQDVVNDLKVIERHGSRIVGIIRQLLTFSRKTPFEFIATDLNQVIADAVTLIEKPFVKEGIYIEVLLAYEPLIFSGSPNHLQQVFLNLLNNARDAMPQEGGRIWVRTFKTASSLVAEMQDNGIGIAPDIVDKIFDPFFTTKKVGKGTGLGLSVSYGIIRDHSGEINVKSMPDEGTTFQVIFPRQEGVNT